MNARVVGIVVLAASTVAASAAAQGESLLPGSRILTGSTDTRPVLVADLDGDGLPDLITTPSHVSADPLQGILVIRGLGDRQFAPPVQFAGSYGRLFASGDFTGDGLTDVLALGSLVMPPYPNPTHTRHLWVHPGLGDGTFGDAIDSNVGQGQAFHSGMALGDLDGDGRTDVAMLDGFTNLLALAFGNGDGSFGNVQQIVVGEDPYGVVLDDVNHDGALDAVVTLYVQSYESHLAVLLGHGDGTFGWPILTPVGVAVRRVLTADFDGDAFPDAAVTSFNASAAENVGIIRLLRGTGDGTFSPVTQLAFPMKILDLRCLDFDEDGRLDLVACGFDWPSPGPNNSGFVVLKGQGGFAFAAPAVMITGGRPTTLGIDDLDRDGHADVVLGEDAAYAIAAQPSDLGVAYGHPGGGFASSLPIDVGFLPSELVSVDFDHDSDEDLVASTLQGIVVLLADDEPVPGPPVILVPDPARHFALADMNGDDLLDLVYESKIVSYPPNGEGSLKLALATGTGLIFADPVTFDAEQVSDLAVLDIDGDGRRDVAAAFRSFAGGDTNKLGVWLGHGDGTLAAPTFTSTVQEPLGLLAVHLDGDAFGDLVVANGLHGTIGLCFGSAGGALSPASLIAVPGEPSALAAGDLDRDGDLDLVVGSRIDGRVSVLAGDGQGHFALQATAELESPSSRILVLDLDRDGALDLVSAHPQGNTILFRRGVGDGTFEAARGFFTCWTAADLAAADFDHDGFQDLAILSHPFGQVWIELNHSAVWSDLGHALALPSGSKPHLTGRGDPIPDHLVSLAATGVPAPSPGLLFMGLDTVLQPFMGGTLVPRVDLAVPLRPDLPLDGRWPKGLDAGTPVYFQAWFTTPGGAMGATNALVTIAQ